MAAFGTYDEYSTQWLRHDERSPWVQRAEIGYLGKDSSAPHQWDGVPKVNVATSELCGSTVRGAEYGVLLHPKVLFYDAFLCIYQTMSN